MSSPPPPDPYLALGVAPDADIAAIRSAHRKLVLKHHPDRIQDPALKEKGQDAFTKIQQAYEILSEPARRSRYDDQVKLAALRKEAMRDSPSTSRSQPYSARPTPTREPAPREYSAEDRAFYETRKPRHEEYTSSRERFEEPMRTTSRKHQDYDRTSSAKKSAEKERSEKSSKSAAWTKAQHAVNFGIRLKKDSEKSKSGKSKETKERERRNERAEKERGSRHVYPSEDSDSDTATHVTSSTVKPSKSSRHTPQSSTSRPSTATRRPTQGDESEDSDYSRKWESSFDKSRAYIEKAAAGAGKRPPFERHESGSFWSSTLRSGSDSERHPTSTGRHSYDDEIPRARPSMPTQNSAPDGLKSRVDDRSPKSDRRSGASATQSPRGQDTYNKPTMTRSQTMPTTRSSSKRDAAPKNSSNLKHTETQDSGYGSSSSPHTPDPRDESPPRRTTTRARYQIVDPESEDEKASRIHRVDDEDDRRRRYASPERDSEKRRPERPRVSTTNSHVRGKSSRDSPIEPKLRRGDSARDSPSDKQYSSSREKLYGEMDEPYDREPRAYKHNSGEKTNIRSPRAEAFSRYEDPRVRDFAPGSRFQADARGFRRPSVQGF